MGERSDRSVFEPKFNRSLRVEGSASEMTGNLGALALREVAEQLMVPQMLSSLHDPRDQDLITFPFQDLVMTRLLMMGLGWTDQDDADTWRGDPALRAAVHSGRGSQTLCRPLPSQPTLSRMMGVLACDYNRDLLESGLRKLSLRRAALERTGNASLTIDVDSFPVLTHGHQEGAAYNGYYKEVVLHPLLALADTGDLLAVDLRPGNVYTSVDVKLFLEPVLLDVRAQYEAVWVRLDAGFADGELFDWLDAQDVRFVARLKSNAVLVRHSADWRARMERRWAASRVAGAAPREATYEFFYRAEGWSRKRRVVAVVVERLGDDGQMEVYGFYLCTNAGRRTAGSAALLSHYRQRGCAEARIGDFVGNLLHNLPSHPHDRNEALLRLAAIAYELCHALRRSLEQQRQQGLSLRRLRETVLAIPGSCLHHARTVLFRISAACVEVFREVAAVLSLRDPPTPVENTVGAR